MKSRSAIITQFFNANYEMLCIYAKSIIGDNETAKDIVQDLFLSLSTNKSIEEDISRPYLFKAVKNRCVTHLRRKSCHQRYIEIQVKSSQQFVEINYLEYQELKQKFDRCFEDLPQRSKEVFTLGKLEHITQKEIGQLLNIKIPTIKSHMSKALSL
ncbi:sigma-70 family RNA polymerase sigma factor, partial [Prolixibacteraceae bacterium]|nr:sigma-70 family RNA polymerase sigma factor [Prolixibacteraceae bacterium]